MGKSSELFISDLTKCMSCAKKKDFISAILLVKHSCCSDPVLPNDALWWKQQESCSESANISHTSITDDLSIAFEQ